jgi:hypothetical protein
MENGGVIMNPNKTWITIIGLFLICSIMICEPTECGANHNFIKGVNKSQDSNLTQSTQGQFHVEMAANDRRFAQNSANNSRSSDGLTVEKLKNAEYRSLHYGDNTLKNLRAGERKFDPDGNQPVRLNNDVGRK